MAKKANKNLKQRTLLGFITILLYYYALRPVYIGDFCRGNWMQFFSRFSCNSKIARVNQVRFLVRFVATISQWFRKCLKAHGQLYCDKNRLCKRAFTSLKLERLTTKIPMQNANSHKCIELRFKSIKDFENFGRHFLCEKSSKILAAWARMYLRRWRNLFQK